MSLYPTAASPHQGNKKSHWSAGFGDAASSPLSPRTPCSATSVRSRLSELTLSPHCSQTDLHSCPNCSLKWKTQQGSDVKRKKFIPSPLLQRALGQEDPATSHCSWSQLTKAGSVGSTSSPWPLRRREPELFLAQMIQHKEAFIAQQQASRASSHHASSQVLNTRGQKFLQTPDSVSSLNICL